MKVALQDRLREARSGLGLHQRKQLLLGLEQVAREVDLGDVVRVALLDGDGDEDEPAVRRQLDRRLAELHVQVAAVVIEPLEDVLVPREGVLAVGARAGEEAPEAALLGEHRALQLVGRDGAVPDEADLLDRDLGVLVDDEHDVDLVVGQGIEAPGDLGEEVALLDVFVLHLLRRLANPLRVEDLELLHLEGVLQVVARELLVALQPDVVDGRLLADQHGELVPGPWRSDRRDVQLDVVEVAHLPDGEQRILQLALVEGIARLHGERRADGVALHAPVALHHDGGRGLGGGRRRHKRCAQRGGNGHGDQNQGGQHAPPNSHSNIHAQRALVILEPARTPATRPIPIRCPACSQFRQGGKRAFAVQKHFHSKTLPIGHATPGGCHDAARCRMSL